MVSVSLRSMSDNPLLADTFPLAFDAVRAEHVLPAIEALIAESEAALEAIEGDGSPPTFENVLLAYDRATTRLGRIMAVVMHLEGVATSDDLRAAYNEAQPKYLAFASAIPRRSALWDRVQAYLNTEEAQALTGARRRFADQVERSFRRNGADLSPEDKEKLAALDVELGALTTKYAQNTLDATNAFELYVEEARLGGLPERAKQAARKAAEDKGKEGFRLTLQAPSFIPVLTYADDAGLREEIHQALRSLGTAEPHDNRSLVAEILRLRREKATLLGCATFSDLVLEERMAKTGAEARRFVDDLTEKTKASFEREKDELLAFRRELEGPDAPELQPWDVSYYAEKMRQAKYAFDAEALRPYFAFEKVLTGVFDLASTLFGVRFEPWPEATAWHESVRPFKVIDESDSWRAVIYVDPYPREEKRGGAWMHGLLGRGRVEGDQRHLAVLATNVTPPLEGDALLSHQEVETVFHETGHLLHHCLSQVELISHAGTDVAWDFVELPSQILENWCWEKESLDRFARHVETGETIPAELLDAMLAAKTFRAATAQMRQLGFASVDLALHQDYDPARDGDVMAFARAHLERFAPTPLPEDAAMIAHFGHLFGSPVGYASGYYSYKWAEVLDADAFGRFKEEGLLAPEVGRAFRDCILARGDEVDPAQLFRDFRGRDPSVAPLLERLGIRAGA